MHKPSKKLLETFVALCTYYFVLWCEYWNIKMLKRNTVEYFLSSLDFLASLCEKSEKDEKKKRERNMKSTCIRNVFQIFLSPWIFFVSYFLSHPCNISLSLLISYNCGCPSSSYCYPVSLPFTISIESLPYSIMVRFFSLLSFCFGFLFVFH